MSAKPRRERAAPEPLPPDLRDLIDAALTRADWIAVLAAQADAARQGDARAAQLLMQYRWGRPAAAERQPNTTPITEIAIIPPPGR